jgi:hypothetical protein
MLLALSGFVSAQTMPPKIYVDDYAIFPLPLLNRNYEKIPHGTSIQFNAYFHSYHWEQPFKYIERLKVFHMDAENFNFIQMVLKNSIRGLRYYFPILMFNSAMGHLHQLRKLKPKEGITVYGKFYNLPDSEYAILVDVIETFQNGGNNRKKLLDFRLPLTPTPTCTVTPTPGPSLWQRILNHLHPPTATPTPTVTPS